MKNIPEKIYLQIDDDEVPEDFNELEVTWCSDRINENDIAYVREPSTEHPFQSIIDNATDSDPEIKRAVEKGFWDMLETDTVKSTEQSGGTEQECVALITYIRNSFVEMMPTGEVKAWDLIQSNKAFVDWLDGLPELITRKP